MPNLTTYFFKLIQDDLNLLGSNGNIKHIKALSAILPETDRIAFELSLHETNNIDVHYNIRIKNKRIFNTFLKTISSQNNFEHKNWLKVVELLKKWKGNSKEVYNKLDAVFLEFDTSKKNEIHPPAIFLKVKENINRGLTLEFVKEIILEINSQEYYQKLEKGLMLINQSIPKNASISYVGLMLSRELPILRINTCGLKSFEIIKFLKKINWNGNFEEVEFFINNIHPLIDVCILSFDIYENKILDKIGFEFKIKKPQLHEKRIHKVFELLRKKELLTSNKEEYLLNCNKFWTPQTTSWHPSLVYNSLLKPLGSTDHIDYFLSHLKYVISKENSSVKAYTGMCQSFTESTPIEYIQFTSIENTIQFATDFLLKKNNQSGYWTDYFAFGSVSDQWITGLIGSLILIIDPSLKTNTILIESNKLLNSKNKFGYNQCTVADGDSTAWVILFNKLIENPKWETQYINFKQKYLDKNGFITYIESPLEVTNPSWKEAHKCVTASANLIKEEYSNLISDSVFESKWWVSQFYTSALLSISGFKFEKHDQLIINQEINQIALDISLKKKINIFNLAMLLISSSLIENENKKSLINHLANKQLSNGSWEGDAKMKLNDNTNKVVVDQNNLVTTAFVILALKINKL